MFYLHVFCGISQQTSERDCIGDCSQVDEQDGRQRLDVQCIVEITGKERGFPFNVKYKASTKTEQKENKTGRFYITDLHDVVSSFNKTLACLKFCSTKIHGAVK